MHVHLVGVAGTGMGALAGLLAAAGHKVSGSDVAFHPPMGPALARWGIETKVGFSAANLEPRPDLVVVGNVCRRDNVEARAAIDGGIAYTSMPGAIESLFLAERAGWVVAGTHGKTTTTTLLAYLLERTGAEPGFLVGGIPRDYGESFRVGAAKAPFVIEGDEYDSAFFEKTPKFLRYRPERVILTSIEHDHVDIYPDEASYVRAFEALIARIPEHGVLVAFAGDAKVREVASRARCRVVYYALTTDDVGDVSPTWLAAPIAAQGGAQPLELFVGGTSCGRMLSPLSGAHNVRNATAAIALVAEGLPHAPPVQVLAGVLRTFGGVKRRQELLGEARGVRVYDDFAHHPTAVAETIAALRAARPGHRMWAVFEPRSASSCRRVFQDDFARAFQAADQVIVAPVFRSTLPEEQRLLVPRLVADLASAGVAAREVPTVEDIVATIAAEAREGDDVLVMSNGGFGGIHGKLLEALA